MWKSNHPEPLPGHKFGQLTIVEDYTILNKKTPDKIVMHCSCGRERQLKIAPVIYGRTSTCGKCSITEGDIFNNIRKELNITHKQLSKKLNISPGQLAQIESKIYYRIEQALIEPDSVERLAVLFESSDFKRYLKGTELTANELIDAISKYSTLNIPSIEYYSKIYDTRLTSIILNKKITIILSNNQINTIKEILAHSQSDIQNIKGIGKRFYDAIIRKVIIWARENHIELTAYPLFIN